MALDEDLQSPLPGLSLRNDQAALALAWGWTLQSPLPGLSLRNQTTADQTNTAANLQSPLPGLSLRNMSYHVMLEGERVLAVPSTGALSSQL